MPTLSLQDKKEYDGSRAFSELFLHFKEHVLGIDSTAFLSLVNVAEGRQNLKIHTDGTFPLALFWYKYSSRTRNLK